MSIEINRNTVNSATTAPPVHRLGHDMLLEVFANNADMFLDPTALATTFVTAQVCNSWRTLMLETPSLWGHLIDVDYLCQIRASVDWFIKIVQRSGSSDLWIKAVDNRASTEQLDRYLFSLLAASWQRVQRLMVVIDASTLDPYSSPRWSWLYTPAQNLRVFDVDFTEKAPKPSPSLPPLFANEAPVLRQFRARYWPFNLRAPWIRDLRSLYIGNPFTLHQAMAAISKAEDLEMLQIDNVVGSAIVPAHFTPFRLRRLECLLLMGGPENCPVILDNIDVPPWCTLTYFPIDFFPMTFSDAVFAPAVRALAKFARRFFQRQPPTQLSLRVMHCFLTFLDGVVPWAAGYHLWLPCGLGLAPKPEAVATFLAAFALPELATVTEMQLRLPAHTPIGPLAAFFACLPAVETLTTDDTSVAYIFAVLDENAKSEDVSGGVFPALKTINLAEDQFAAYEEAGELSAIHALVSARLQLGKLIEVRNIGQVHEWSR